MKLLDKTYGEEKIVCPKCGKSEFADIDFRPTRYSTYQIFCADEKCKTDMLIPTKKIADKIIIKVE